MNQAIKYRPVLTEANITTLVNLINEKLAINPSKELQSCRKVLAPYLFKITNGCVTPAYVMEGTKSLEGKLGVSAEPQLSPVEKREAAWKKLEEEGAANCSNDELELAATYRWEHGMMTDEEAIAFETQGFN